MRASSAPYKTDRYVPVRYLFRRIASLPLGLLTEILCVYRMVQGPRWQLFGTAVALVGLIVPVALVLQNNQNRLSSLETTVAELSSSRRATTGTT